MTLPTAGLITASMVNTELGRAADAPFSFDDPAVRALAGKMTGQISFADLRGKSMGATVTSELGMDGTGQPIFIGFGLAGQVGGGSVAFGSINGTVYASTTVALFGYHTGEGVGMVKLAGDHTAGLAGKSLVVDDVPITPNQVSFDGTHTVARFTESIFTAPGETVRAFFS